MNKVIIMGRATKDAEIRTTSNGNQTARFTLAVDRMSKDAQADFIGCVSFGKGAEFADKFIKKGRKFLVEGHIMTGSYKDKDGKTVYTTDVATERVEFADSKPSGEEVHGESRKPETDAFMPISDDVEEFPFN